MQKHNIMRCIMGWIFFCSIILYSSVQTSNDSVFFRIGPSPDLTIFDAKIDTFPKYFIIVLYTIISTVVRTLQQEIITPWLIQNVQNDKPKDDFIIRYAQEISLGECLYRWFDWFMYMHILLAQVDMMVIELLGNLICVYYVTRMYIRLPLPT